MPDPTPVAMRLAKAVYYATDGKGVSNIILDDAARQIDDAGVREAVEHLDWIKNFYGFTSAGDRAKLALFALTGETQEVSDASG